MGNRIDRYHREVYFPPWYEESMKVFVGEILSTGPLTFSMHCVEKVMEYTIQFGKNFFQNLVKSIRRGVLDTEKVFEFYSTKGGNITKACFRFSFEKLPVDIVLVISSSGVLITMYTINEGDNHDTLNKKLYKKGE